MLDKTFYDKVIDQTAKDFAKSADISLITLPKVVKISDNIVSLDSSKESTVNLSTGESVFVSDSEYPEESKYYDKYFEDVTKTIYKPEETMTPKKAIETAMELRASLGNKLAGVLVYSDAGIINILHPVTALSLVELSNHLTRTGLQIAVYIYNDRETLDEEYLTETANLEKINDGIDTILKAVSSKVVGRKSMPTASIVEGHQVTQTFTVSLIPGEDPRHLYYLVPNQIITKGIVAPYYGTSIIRYNLETNTTTGKSLSPMRTANVSYYNSNKDWSSVCTGSKSNTTVEGLQTLNHCNMSSPYYRDIMLPGALAYADACIDKSIQIYKLSGLFND